MTRLTAVARGPVKAGIGLAALALLAALLTAVTSLVLSSRLSSEDAILADMDQIVQSVSDQAAANTENFLHPAVSTTDLLSALVDDELLDFTSPTAKPLLLDILQSNDVLDGVYVGSAEGEFLYLSRASNNDDRAFTAKVIVIDEGDRVVEITDYNSNAEDIGSRRDDGDSFDPRTRVWYTEAAASPDIGIWTDPYVFFESGLPGVTRAKSVLRDGEASLVVGVDIRISRLSEFMAERTPSPNGGAFIMTKSQMMVAYPDPTAIADSDGLLVSNEVDDPAVQLAGLAIAQQLGTAPSDRSDAEINGEPADFVYTDLPTNDDWVLIAWSPHSDFLSEVRSTSQTNRWIALGTGVLILVELLGVAIWVFLQFNRNERRLVQSEAASEQSTIERNLAERELANTVDQLEASNRDLEAYAYAAAHDLRTPLRAIGGYGELIGRETGHDKPDIMRIREWSGLIISGYDRMGRMMDDLLQHARISKVEIDLREVEAVDTQPIAEAVVSDLASEFAKAECTIIVGELPRARIDPLQLSRLFQNLLENALRFREPNRPLVVTISGFEDVDHVRFCVADNGIGIAGRDRTRIFESFSQAHDSAGLGLGLSLVKRIVQDHGGMIHAESEVGQGSVFEFTLPRETKDRVHETVSAV